MKRQRLAGIEKEVLRVISKVIFEEVKNPKIRGKVSVTKVHITEDLKFADTYFSILPQIKQSEKENSKINEEEILQGLNQIRSFLRKKVADEISIRYIPEIRIKLDKSIENAIKITELLNNLKV